MTMDKFVYIPMTEEELEEEARLEEISEIGFVPDYEYYDSQKPVDMLEIHILGENDEFCDYGQGINWGVKRIQKNKKDSNKSFLPYFYSFHKYMFFPERVKNLEKRKCPAFKVMTKDAGSFHMRSVISGRNKGLHSIESNAILGEWIRERIGAASGGYVTKAMLEKYGKTKVKFRKYSDGVYLMDF